MGKTIVILILIAAAAYFIYERVGRTPSEEEMLVTHLKERFAVVVDKFTSASGRSGLIGIDTTGDMAGVVNKVLALRDELAELRARLTETRAIQKADALAEKVETFIKKNEIKAP